MDFPLISIITVTFNAGEVIGKTMKSLEEQSYRDFEHIVIDGGSKDNTLEVIKNYDIPESSITSEPDKGLYDAMNKGLARAKGKYVIFLNAGDAFHSAETLSHYAGQASEGRDIIYGDTVIVNQAGDVISPRHLGAPDTLSFESFADGMLICHQAFMVRKDLVPQYNLDYRFSADYDWCVNCIAKSSPGNCSNLKEVTIDYLSDGLTDKNKWKSLRERFRIMSIHYGTFKTLTKHFQFIFRAIKRGKV